MIGTIQIKLLLHNEISDEKFTQNKIEFDQQLDNCDNL